MTAQYAHTIIAAGVSDPQLLAQWRRDPAALSRLGVDPNALNIEALWKFAGLITKIRHNSLRSDLPLTFLALNCTGLEIEIFANYSLRHTALKAAKPNSNEEKSNSLVKFLECWLNLTIPDHALIWDIIRHEHALSQTYHLVPDTQQKQFNIGESCEVEAYAIPVIQGSLLTYRMSFDLKTLVERFQRRPVDLSGLEPGEFFTGYWWSGEGSQINLLDLDALGFYMLSMIDGTNSIKSIAERLDGDEKFIQPQDLFAPLQELMDLGLLYLRLPVSDHR